MIGRGNNGNARRRASASQPYNVSGEDFQDDAPLFENIDADATRSSPRRRRSQRRIKSILRKMPESQVLDGIEAQVRRNLWRDFLLVVIGCLALTAISYVETHASEERHVPFQKQMSTLNVTVTTTNHGIVDTGFSMTTPIYEFLKIHRHSYNDFFAFCNSVILLIPGVYGAYTVYVGDYSYIFRILFTQLLRSFCGWATYLPPSNEYLMSYYDFPDVVQCLSGQANCSADYRDESADDIEVLPFVSFFSGHVGE